MESNLSIKTSDIPKFNIETVSSAIFGKEGSGNKIGGGSGESIKNIHEKLSKLFGHIRKSLVRIKALEFNVKKITPTIEKVEKIIPKIEKVENKVIEVEKIIPKIEKVETKVIEVEKIIPKIEKVETKLVVNTEKTTEVETKVIVNTERIVKIEKILENKKDNVGGIGGNQKDLTKSLIETNKILVGIQQQLALQSSNEQKEQKTESEEERRKKSRGKLKAEESALEKSGKRIGKAVGKVTSKILSPIKGLFDQVLDFILTLGAGVAVNAAFEWLSKEENRKKIENAFEYVKEHWKWIAGVAAGIVLFGPAVSLISTIVSLAGALLTVGGFVASILGAPAFLTLLGIITAAGGIYALFEFIKNKSAGGRGIRAAIEAQNKIVDDAGISREIGNIMESDGGQRQERLMLIRSGPFKGYQRLAKSTDAGAMLGDVSIYTRNADNTGFVGTEEQIKMHKNYKKNIKRLTGEKSAMDAEIKAANKAIITERNLFGVATNAAQIADFNAKEAEIVKKYNQGYIEKYGDPTFGGVFNNLNLPGRAMGGPVTSGKPYLVGERGPEIFAPNVDGSVINNMRTEKIYQMISSKRKGRGGINMITLPPITNQMPPPEIPVPQGPATEVPDISSVNMADPYRQITPMLYGITV